MDTNTETVAKGAVDLLQFALGIVGGATIALLVGVILWTMVRLLARRHESIRAIQKRVRTPFLSFFPIVGAWLGMQYTMNRFGLDSPWMPYAQHAVFILTILVVGWLCFVAARAIEDIAVMRAEGYSSRRLTTQAQMLRRIFQVAIAVFTIVAIILSFPDARVLMGSVLASAGVISIVAGLAAQDSLSNTFAGLQLTFTDAIRVGDYLSVDGMNGTVEEITLTYVVLRIWDDRRVILPSTTFTKNRFENWTRVHTKLLGTVELHLDWRAPIALIRQEVDRLLSQTELWDQRTVNVQVTDSNEQWILVRVVVSAENSGNLWDLKCYLRENLVRWLVENAPYSLSRVRWQQEEIKVVSHNRSDEEIVRLAQELTALENIDDTNTLQTPPGLGAKPLIEPAKTAQEARLQASKKRAEKVRRKRIRDRVNELHQQEDAAETASKKVAAPLPKPVGTSETVVLSASDLLEVNQLVKPADSSTRSDRLYSGSEDADERAKLTQGPGIEAFQQREVTTVMRALRDGEITLDDALSRFAASPEAQAKIRTEHDLQKDKNERNNS
ncbi:mechanosensitive ion channel family protein [Gleimia sp. 6138-11-ORH1]|uniref:mechanosensitive ion channel family protein n=1 Tax=Gleimia sp. 6138-11-ORH1 TaxID=2973937 RepID=UPI0021698B27|nr:mechanosensitive ion channel family protein [Gleimia sp. 6138-11-ORH1]MCS4484691.1 mechanosensitive ion channel family protein [Gleimia sp. 6138-11-ORH1]